ncbi:MAG: acyltransferase family protein [Pseudomonadota bacterium]
MVYRREIDGLRAIAVVAVMVYHAKFEAFGGHLLAGGYLGVDIFFVISGYLISRIILAELDQSGRISFWRFYERRARRILPALIVVSIAATIVAYQLLLPEDLEDFSRSVIASFLFISNFHFYFETTEYGADDALLEPFLHTWSLGVEEQFYLVFPILALVLFRYHHARLLQWFLGIAIASFVFALVAGHVNAELNFFLPMSRAWELLAGTMVAYVELHRPDQIRRWHWRGWAPLGIAMILVPMALSEFYGHHPGVMTVLPVAGTALVLLFGSATGPIGWLLSNSAARAVGLLSYSLYLWHFPIFAFGRFISATPGLPEKSVWILLTVALSLLTYVLVERSFRQRAVIGGWLFATSLTCTLVVVLSVNGVIASSKGFPLRLPEALHPDSAKPNYRSMALEGVRCHSHADGACVFEINSDASTILVLTGDSHADSLSNDLFEKVKTRDLGRYVHMSAAGCPIVIGFAYEGRRYCSFDAQQGRLDQIEALAKESRTIVVYFTRTPALLSGVRFDGGPGYVEGGPPFRHLLQGDREENLVSTLKRLSDQTELILVYPMPEVGVHVQRYFQEKLRRAGPGQFETLLTTAPLGIPYEIVAERMGPSYAAYDQVEAHRVYPQALFCNTYRAGWCVTHDAERLFYTDSNHPNEVGADMINREIMKVVDRILVTP